MPIGRRALFALSIALTASVIAYPDLPPDIPPTAGRDGAYIGTPLVAFFLPITAMAIWWIAGSLGRSASASLNAGAAIAMFLSAFHIVMLIGFISGNPWLVRILGILVGAFLIVTGNELPRVRPSLQWSIRDRQKVPSGGLWRNVQRFAAYIRVMMGVSVCLAALLGTSAVAVTQVIVLAVGVEIAVRVALALFVARRRAAVIGISLVWCHNVASDAWAQGIPRTKIDELPAFLDNTVPKLMQRGHALGVAVAVVHDGRVVLLRGYGQSRLEESLNASWFLSLADARRKIAAWRQDYNQQRPHSSLGYLSPCQFAQPAMEKRV